MADKFHLDPDAARRSASTSQQSTDRLRTAYGKLTSALDEHDGCWGSDDIGESFAKGYVDNATTARQSSKDTLDGLDSWSKGVNSAVDNFTDLDGQNADVVDHSIADQLEHPPPDPA